MRPIARICCFKMNEFELTDRLTQLILEVEQAFPSSSEHPFSAAEEVVDPVIELTWLQKRHVNAIYGQKLSEVRPRSLYVIEPYHLTNRAYVYYAPVFLLCEGYDVVGFGPQKCALCDEFEPARSKCFGDAFARWNEERRNWLSRLLDDLSFAQVSALKSYVKLYVDIEAPGVMGCWEGYWGELMPTVPRGITLGLE